MTGLLVGACAAFGLLIGSFLTVVIARVPPGESVVRPRSRCACGVQLAARDNVPVLSWLLLHGRARCCGRTIPVRYPLVELATATSFGVVAAVTTDHDLLPVLPALLYLSAASIALAVIDVDHKRLPDAIVLPSYPIAAVLLTGAALALGEPDRVLRAAICAAAMFGFYFVLALVNPNGMGFGDVKLAGVLGLYLGWAGYGQAVVGTFLAFVLGGVLGVALMLVGRAGRKTAIPFGPFMLLGAWVSLAFGGAISAWYLGSLGL